MITSLLSFFQDRALCGIKRILFFLTSFFFCINLYSQNGKLDSIEAVNPQKITTVFKTNPTAILIGVIPLFTSEYRMLVEFPSAPLQSSQLGFSYLGKSPFVRMFESDTLKKNPNAIFIKMYISGFRIQGSYRFFLNGLIENMFNSSRHLYAPEGLYISPHLSYSTVKITYKYANQYDVYFRVTHFNINLLTGFQFALTDKITIDAFTGLGYKKNEWTEHYQKTVKTVVPPADLNIPGYFSPVKFNLGINLGYIF